MTTSHRDRQNNLYELEQRGASANDLIHIAEFLDLNTDYLLTGEKKPISLYTANFSLSGVYQDVGLVGGNRVWPSAPTVLTLVSTDANDTVGGTGARLWLAEGLYQERDVTDVVAMNGLTPNPGTQPFDKINRLILLEAGSGRVNAGQVTGSLDGQDQLAVPAGGGISVSSHWSTAADWFTVISYFRFFWTVDQNIVVRPGFRQNGVDLYSVAVELDRTASGGDIAVNASLPLGNDVWFEARRTSGSGGQLTLYYHMNQYKIARV